MTDMTEAIKSAVASAREDLGGSSTEVAPEPEAAPDKSVSTISEADAKEAEVKPPVEEAPAPKPKAEAKPAEEEEEGLTVSEEELAAIDANPALKKAYKSMLRDYRKKTGSVAEQRKALSDKARIVELMTEDPDGALRALAAIRGVKLAEPEKEAPARSEVEEAIAELEKVIGVEGSRTLRPVLEGVTNAAIKRILAERVEPLEKMAREYSQTALAQSVESGLAKFKANVAEHEGEWDDELETTMADLIQKVQPVQGTDFDDYLDILYQTATSRRGQAASTKAKVARLKAAAATQEPGRPTRPSAEVPQGITKDTPIAEAIALAVASARRELGAR